ncbi:MAG: CIA30 family protein [Armatimonadota bacterium]|nr:MAG: CIA30 family protein [Armatimonadota bacterium]
MRTSVPFYAYAVPLVAAWAVCVTIQPVRCGPIAAPGPPDLVVDDFEDEPKCEVATEGETTVRTDLRPGIARGGNQSLLVRIHASAQNAPRHVCRLVWRFEGPTDWSQFAGIQFWMQALTGDVRPYLLLHEAGGSNYRARVPVVSRNQGEWQHVGLEFADFAWNFESQQDANQELDVERISAISLWLQVAPGSETAFAIDELGAYQARPQYAGPKVSLHCARPACLFEPGQTMEVVARAERLPDGEAAELAIIVRDFWGTEILSQHHDFTANTQGECERGAGFSGTGYFDVEALLKVRGEAVWEETLGVATIPPLPAAEAEPPESVFGIWVGSLDIPRRYGVRWHRTYCQPWDFEPDAAGGYRYVAKPGEPFAFHRIAGMEPILYFRGMPLWLTSRPDRVDYRKFKPKSWDEYGRFVEYYCSLVADDVDFYEVWNEPVPYAYWMGTIEDVVKLHEVTYRAVHAADPTATVLGPCPYSFVWDFLERFFELGGGQWLDAIVLHAYTSEDPDAGQFRENLRRVRDLAAKYGVRKDLYITEMGYSTPDVTEREQAEYLVRAYLLAMAEDVRVLIWHMFWDYVGDAEAGPGFAIFRHEWSPRPAFVALATLIRQVEQAEYVDDIAGLPDKVRGFRFRRDGKAVCVCWCWDDKPKQARIEWRGAAAVVCDIMGVETTVPVTDGHVQLTLTGSPVFVKER